MSLFLFLVVWASDIGAYLAGRRFGGPKLAPAVSPNKTWSGAAGGLASRHAGRAAGRRGDRAGAALVAAACCWSPRCSAVLAQLGDLFESWLKRRFNVKDSSALIPGHGGLLDRLDAVLARAGAALSALLAPDRMLRRRPAPAAVAAIAAWLRRLTVASDPARQRGADEAPHHPRQHRLDRPQHPRAGRGRGSRGIRGRGAGRRPGRGGAGRPGAQDSVPASPWSPTRRAMAPCGGARWLRHRGGGGPAGGDRGRGPPGRLDHGGDRRRRRAAFGAGRAGRGGTLALANKEKPGLRRGDRAGRGGAHRRHAAAGGQRAQRDLPGARRRATRR